MRILRRCMELGLLTCVGATDVAHSSESFESRFHAFRAEVAKVLALREGNRRSEIRVAFDRQFATVDLPSLSSDDAGYFLRALADVTFHQPDADLTAVAMQVVLRHELTELQPFSGPRLVDQMLLGDRSFGGAAAWRARFSEFDDALLPQVERLNSGHHRMYTISEDGRHLLELDSHIATGDGLIVVGHPACGFSRAAAEWMRDQLGDTGTRLLWLAPVDGNLQLTMLLQWNRQFPSQAFAIARSSDDWQFIDTWDTPQFFWLAGGRIRERSAGWNEGSRALLPRFNAE